MKYLQAAALTSVILSTLVSASLHLLNIALPQNRSHSHRALARCREHGAASETVSTVSLCFVRETVKTVSEQCQLTFHRAKAR
jgi:hypothetical protein